MECGLDAGVVEVGGDLLVHGVAVDGGVLHELEGGVADAEGVVEAVAIDGGAGGGEGVSRDGSEGLVEAAGVAIGLDPEVGADLEMGGSGGVALVGDPVGVDAGRDHGVEVVVAEGGAVVEDVVGPVELLVDAAVEGEARAGHRVAEHEATLPQVGL